MYFKLGKYGQFKYSRINYIIFIPLTVCFQITLIETAALPKSEPSEPMVLMAIPANSTSLKKLMDALGDNHDVEIVTTTTHSPLTLPPRDDGRKYLGLTPPYLIDDDSHYIQDINFRLGESVRYEHGQNPLAFGLKVAARNMFPITFNLFKGAKETNRERALIRGGSPITNYPYNFRPN